MSVLHRSETGSSRKTDGLGTDENTQTAFLTSGTAAEVAREVFGSALTSPQVQCCFTGGTGMSEAALGSSEAQARLSVLHGGFERALKLHLLLRGCLQNCRVPERKTEHGDTVTLGRCRSPLRWWGRLLVQLGTRLLLDCRKLRVCLFQKLFIISLVKLRVGSGGPEEFFLLLP